MRSLVLGGTGFVGGRLVEHLLAAGHDVTVVNRGVSGTVAPGVRVLAADRSDPASLRAALSPTGDWDQVYDVSGVLKVAGSPGALEATLDLLESRVGRYLYVSSIMVYEPSGVFPWAEDAPLRAPGHDSYGAFKAHAERLLLDGPIPATAVRPAAIYGRENNIYGMETAMFLRLRRGLPILLPYAGLVTTSYGHIDDLCVALLHLAGHPGAVDTAVNVTGDGVTSAEYVRTLAEVVGVEPRVVPVPDAVVAGLDEPAWGHLFAARHHGVLDTRLAHTGLGVPDPRPFREGHEQTYRWFLDSALAGAGAAASDALWERGFDLEHEAEVAARLADASGAAAGAGSGCADVLPDAALWRSVRDTVGGTLVPALPPGHERDLAVALGGLARWVLDRDGAGGAPNVGLADAECGTRGHDVRDSRARSAGLADTECGTRGHEVRDSRVEMLVEALRAPSAGASALRKRLVADLDRRIEGLAPLLETFAGHPARDVQPTLREVPDGERSALQAWFRSRLGAATTVRHAVLIPGGHSRRMLRVGVTDPDRAGAEREFVVRIEQGGLFGTEGGGEARLMRALAAAGVPAPPVPWIEPDAGPLGQPFFVMDFVTGSARVDDRALTAYLDALAALHRVDPRVAETALGPVPPDPETAVQAQVTHWLELYRSCSPHPEPLLEEGAAWLRANLRPTGPTVVVHGDPGPGNFLHRDGRVVALTDWEFAHHGDRCEDWTYLGAVRGRKLMDVDAWRARLAVFAPVLADDTTWRAWEAFNQFKGACANLTALALFRDGTVTTPNLPAIGTAVHARFLRRLVDLVG